VGLELGIGGRGDGACPFSVPGGLRTEIPAFLGHAETGLGSGHDDSEANKTTDQGREFRADQPSEGQVRNNECHRGENTELPGGEAFGPGLVLAEEAGQKAEHEDGQDEDHGTMHDGRPLADNLGKSAEIDKVQTGGAGFDGRLGERSEELEADKNGSSDRAERYGEGVEDQADDRSGQGREAQGQQERSSQCGRRAETGRAFDEGCEHEADDDGLDALVTADALHPVLNGFHSA
jgi:hypothetical protein